MFTNNDFNKLCEAAKNQSPVAVMHTSSGNSPLSFGIVNSSANGKRISLSKSLVANLGLDNQIAIIPIPAEGVVMVARDLPFDGAIRGELRGEDKKLWYASNIVLLLTELFGLDFKTRVSRSFNDISINELDGVPVATIRIAPCAANTEATA